MALPVRFRSVRADTSRLCADKRPSRSDRPAPKGRRARVTFEDGYSRVVTMPGEGASNNAHRRAQWGIENLRRRHGAITDLTILYEVS